jgi:hypothetical protein
MRVTYRASVSIGTGIGPNPWYGGGGGGDLLKKDKIRFKLVPIKFRLHNAYRHVVTGKHYSQALNNVTQNSDS